MTRRPAGLGAVLLVVAFSGAAAAQPANDDCAAATMIGALPYTDGVDTSAATTEAGDPAFDCDDGNSYGQESHSVWYRYTSAAGGPIEIDTFGSDYDTIVVVRRGTCGAFAAVASCNNDDYDASFFGEQSRLVATVGAGETVYVEVLSNELAGGNLVLSVKESSIFAVTDEDDYESQRPDAAAVADGTFVIVWEDDDTETIVGRRFCDTGVPLGPAFQISEPDYPFGPQVARTGDDGFVVVWIDDGTLQGRRLGPTGAPIGLQFEVSADYPDYYDFGLAADPAGRFVVTWASFGDDGDDFGIMAKRFDAANTPIGSPFVVNTITTGEQTVPSVAADPDGNFVVVWQSDVAGYPESDEVKGQRFDAAGAPAGSEFQVNVTTTYRQGYAAVATKPNGDFVVAWQDRYASGCGQNCVVGRRFQADGTPQSGEFVVSDGVSGSPGYYVSIGVETSAAGDFAVAWSDENDFPWARAFDSDGTPQSVAFQAGLVEDDYQRNVRVAVADDGDFVVVWDWAPQGSHYKIMARSRVQNPSCPVATVCPPTPRIGCKQPTLEFKGSLTLKDKSPDSHDAAIWKWIKGEATTVGEVGDALTADSYTFCVYDAANVLLAEATAAPGGTCGVRPCWKDLKGLGFSYADKTGEHGLVRKLVVKSGDEGRAKVIVKTQGDGLALGGLPPALPIRAQLASTTGTCWEGEFHAEGVTKSTPAVFGAKVSVGSPSGAFVDEGRLSGP